MPSDPTLSHEQTTRTADPDTQVQVRYCNATSLSLYALTDFEIHTFQLNK